MLYHIPESLGFILYFKFSKTVVQKVIKGPSVHVVYIQYFKIGTSYISSYRLHLEYMLAVGAVR